MAMSENDLRVTRALWALRAYLDAVHTKPISMPVPRQKRDVDHVTDLLTDLMHYCHGGEYKFDVCLKNARINFEAETEEAE